MRLVALIAMALVGSLILNSNSAAQLHKSSNPDSEMPALFKADHVRHNRELGSVTATGNVEISHGGNVLLANSLTYNQSTDTMTATGNVRLLDESGDVMFAEFTELSGDLKDGIAETIRIRLSDNSRLAAVGGRRIGGNRMDFRKAVFTPCQPCRENLEQQPLWQVKAFEVTHDRKRQEIEYTDAFMEIFGIPVFYMPYFSHPDPTVKRKTGMLIPRYGSNTELGTILQVPYYFNLSPTYGVTLTPTISSNEGLALAGEYRHRFVGGIFHAEASGTHATKEDNTKGFRGHFDGVLSTDIDDTWRSGLKINLASDDTYLRRYDIGSDNTLTSHAFVEGFRGRNYASANAYYFQGFRSDEDFGEIPIIHPILDFNHVGQADRSGGRWSFDGNLLALTRTEGIDSRRISFNTGWLLPRISRVGEVYSLYANLRTDAYWVSDAENSDASAPTRSGVSGRIFPKIGLDWQFPFVRHDGRFTKLIEPIAGVIVAPNGGNSDKIPNEDSRDFELDDTNVFSQNRFTGLDRVEGGQRIHYGIKGAIHGAQAGSLSAFLGQSYRIRRDNTFDEETGLDENFSHVIGRTRISPGRLVDILYRFRLNNEDFNPKRNEVTANFGPPALNLSTTYLFIDQQGQTDEFPDRQELTTTLRSKITTKWSFSAATRRNLEPGGGTLNNRFGLNYEDECFALGANFTRTFTQDRDVRPSDTIYLQVRFKYPGGQVKFVPVSGIPVGAIKY